MPDSGKLRWGVLVWVLCFIAFLAMSVAASTAETFPGDVWMARQLQALHGEPQGTVLDAASRPIEWPYWVPVVMIGIAMALWRAGAVAVPVILLALPTRFLVQPLVKELVERPRPSPDLVEVERLLGTYAFPSGHVFNSVVLYGLIFYFATRYFQARALKLPVQALCGFVIVGTAIERVYSGVHWPSDVVGGYLFGGLVLSALIALAEFMARGQRAGLVTSGQGKAGTPGTA